MALAETFVISREASDDTESVFCELRLGDHVGYGEGAPIERYHESAAAAVEFLEEAAGVIGDDPFALDEIEVRLASLPGELAAKAALDMALHDLCGKLAGIPVWRLLGLRRHVGARARR